MMWVICTQLPMYASIILLPSLFYSFSLQYSNRASFMTVEIVLATYNGEAFLSEQIESILAQDYADLRLIIRDDGSTDGTCAIIEAYEHKYPERIRVLRGEKKRLGIVQNFSALLEATTAPYVMCADQDDVWASNKITITMLGMAELEKEWGGDVPLLVHTDSTITDMALAPTAKSFAQHHKLKPEHSPFARVLIQNTVQGCTMMVNRALLALALPIPVAVRMHDMWLALVASGLGHMGYIGQATLQYRQHGSNVVGVRKKTLRERVGHIQNMMESNVTQAVLFQDRFSKLLSDENRKLVAALVKMPDHGFVKRRLVLIHHHMMREPAWQNIAMLLFV